MLSEEQAAVYVAAMLDGEGSVAAVAHGKRQARRVMVASNTNEHLIRQVEYALVVLGVTYRTRCRQPKNPAHQRCYEIQVTSTENFVRLHEVCGPFLTPPKRGKLAALTERRVNQHA